MLCSERGESRAFRLAVNGGLTRCAGSSHACMLRVVCPRFCLVTIHPLEKDGVTWKAIEQRTSSFLAKKGESSD
ncbi:hypothetical protein BC835DRAFT_1374105 [Cytidiella melzeri]|nr:hypothetical protein BC835DRAFT_1374105 [Cytidiella melzeri]